MTDALRNFAYTTVATAPSPATTGTSLVVASGTGALFPPPPFNLTVWDTGVQPTTTNAEIVRVTAISTDTLTIVRAQEGTTAQSIAVGDQAAQNVTQGMMAQLGGFTPSDIGGVGWTFDVGLSNASFAQSTGGRMYYYRALMTKTSPITNIMCSVGTAGASLTTCLWAVFSADGATQLGTTSASQTTAFQSTGNKTVPLGSASSTVQAGTEVLIVNLIQGSTIPAIGGVINAGLAGSLNQSATGFHFFSGQGNTTGLTAIPAAPFSFTGYTASSGRLALLLT